MSNITVTVNEALHVRDVEDETLLVHFLREHLNLTGTHIGCDTSQCGACTVLLDGKAVKSCTILAVTVEGMPITTIEGLATDNRLHDVQTAFRECHALQCGFCTPGMIISAVDMLNRHKGGLDEAIIRHDLDGNLCRCTGYHNIVQAILQAAKNYRAADGFGRV